MKPEHQKPKTWSREIAGAGLFVWALATYRVFFVIGVDDVSAYEDIYNGMTATVWLAATGIFTAKRVTRHLEDRNPRQDWGEE